MRQCIIATKMFIWVYFAIFYLYVSISTASLIYINYLDFVGLLMKSVMYCGIFHSQTAYVVSSKLSGNADSFALTRKIGNRQIYL